MIIKLFKLKKEERKNNKYIKEHKLEERNIIYK